MCVRVFLASLSLPLLCLPSPCRAVASARHQADWVGIGTSGSGSGGPLDSLWGWLGAAGSCGKFFHVSIIPYVLSGAVSLSLPTPISTQLVISNPPSTLPNLNWLHSALTAAAARRDNCPSFGICQRREAKMHSHSSCVALQEDSSSLMSQKRKTQQSRHNIYGTAAAAELSLFCRVHT